MKRLLIISGAVLASVALVSTGFANDKVKARPGTFAGSAADCGSNTVDGDAKKVVAKWEAKVGLADAGNSNHGLVLAKLQPLNACSAAYAVIDGVEGLVVTPGFQLGYDIRNDSPCGSGAPRFNVTTTAGSFHFVGACANDNERSPTPGASGWTRVRFEVEDAGEAFPLIPAGATIRSIALLVDEPGTYVLDNIFINGAVIGKPGNN